MYVLLGIDDTDSETTGNTSQLAFQLGRHLESADLARLIYISGHQLYQHPSIIHTKENHASCLLLDSEELKFREIDLACRQFLRRNCAPSSNPGFTLASWAGFDHELVLWGNNAKTTFLNRNDALHLARKNGFSAAGIFGSGSGVIGALAAIGLRFNGNDGWITWMPGMADLNGCYTQSELVQIARFDLIETNLHRRPAIDDRILIQPPFQPLIKDGKTLLPIHPSSRGSEHQWHV